MASEAPATKQPPVARKAKIANEADELLDVVKAHLTPKMDTTIGYGLAGLLGMAFGYGLHHWGGIGQPASAGAAATAQQERMAKAALGADHPLLEKAPPLPTAKPTSAAAAAPVKARSEARTSVLNKTELYQRQHNPAPLVPTLENTSNAAAAPDTETFGSTSQFTTPSTTSVRMAMSRLLDSHEVQLEGFPFCEDLLTLFSRLTYFCKVGYNEALTARASAAFQNALQEADALCYMKHRCDLNELQPAATHASKAHQHMSRCVGFLLDMHQVWLEYQRPQIEERLAAKQARIRKREERIRAAREAGEDSDEAARDSEEEELIRYDSDSDMHYSERERRDPRREDVYRENALFLQPNLRNDERRRALRRRGRNRLQHQVFDDERKKIQDQLVRMYQEIRSWSVPPCT
jgi:hypothetical protein